MVKMDIAVVYCNLENKTQFFSSFIFLKYNRGFYFKTKSLFPFFCFFTSKLTQNKLEIEVLHNA